MTQPSKVLPLLVLFGLPFWRGLFFIYAQLAAAGILEQEQDIRRHVWFGLALIGAALSTRNRGYGRLQKQQRSKNRIHSPVAVADGLGQRRAESLNKKRESLLVICILCNLILLPVVGDLSEDGAHR